jgi:hypothetical protein
VNWLFFMGVAQGAAAGRGGLHRGLWSRPIRQFALSFVAFLPLAYWA